MKGGDATLYAATEADCAGREVLLVRNIFRSIREMYAPIERANAEGAPLSEIECAHLRLFVARLGVEIVDDTSLFSRRERNWFLFLRWLYRHGKLG